MEKKHKYITISLNESDTKKAESIAREQARPLAQLLGLMISQQLNPNERANISENLKIYRDGAQVNELNATGAAAALELAKVFVWHYNDPKSVKISGIINQQGQQDIKACYSFAGAGASYRYEYIFTGQACENLPRV